MSRHRFPSRRVHRRSLFKLALAALTAGPAAGVPPASAQPPNDDGTALGIEAPDGRRDLRVAQEGERVSLEQAIELARRRFDGEVVSAETRTVNGREVHVVRIIQDGRTVRTVQIDAATGRIRR